MRADKVAGFINNNKTIQKVLKSVNKNPAVYGAVSSFGLAAIMRPAFIGALPFKEKKDKQYSQASAIAAGTVELVSSVLLFIPLNKSIQKASDNLYKTTGTVFSQNPKALRQFKSVTNRSLKLATLLPISFLRFGLVKPIVNTFFGGKDENK